MAFKPACRKRCPMNHYPLLKTEPRVGEDTGGHSCPQMEAPTALLISDQLECFLFLSIYAK